MSVVVFLLFVAFIFSGSEAQNVSKKFPNNFRFGIGSASYQVEGAWNVADKGENIWDYYTHMSPYKISSRANGDVACNSYYLYKRDVEMLRELGVDYYRFSISWTRILPNGLSNKISQDGIRYYNNLIDELLKYNITPFITIYHWDLPQTLQNMGGWTNPSIVDHFENYAKIIFENFGDRVKWFTTINEPLQICYESYGSMNSFAPDWTFPGIADYLCGHYLLLAHARVWHLYQNQFKARQMGRVGITIYSPWVDPETNSKEDLKVAEDAMQFLLGWHGHPIFSKEGDYPQIMKDKILNKSLEQGFKTSRLPTLTQDEIWYIKGTYDFFGLNWYTSVVYSKTYKNQFPKPSKDDDLGYSTYQRSEWEGAAASWFRIYNPGLRNILNWIRKEYNNPEVIITENGFPTRTGLVDKNRVKYIDNSLQQVLNAINDGCNVTAVTLWSLMDNFEWGDGYDVLFGLYEVDFKSKNLTRTPRMSAYVFKEVIRTRFLNSSFVPNMTMFSSAIREQSFYFTTLVTITAMIILRHIYSKHFIYF